jgi:hypothetical protein
MPYTICALHKNKIAERTRKDPVMASARTLNDALRLEPRGLPARRFLAGLKTYLSAIREASAASHAYEEMARHGTPHQEAVERVFEKHFSGRR